MLTVTAPILFLLTPSHKTQAKVRLLAGGTDGEQLAEVLLDREEELRTKDIEIQNLTLQFQAAALEGEAFEADRSEYEVRPRFQGDGPVCKRRVPVNND